LTIWITVRFSINTRHYGVSFFIRR
jgi:hypothetical protein